MTRVRAGRRSAPTRTLLVFGTLMLALLTPALSPSIASAVPGGPPVQQPRVESGMRLVDFSEAVARAHGFEVVTLPDGSRASVPAAMAESARHGGYTPTTGVVKNPGSGDDVSTYGYGQIRGDCGYSWVSLEPRGGSQANFGTGMSLVAESGGPWDIHWTVDISDNGGHSSPYFDEYDGILSTWGWSVNDRFNLTRGWANATVTWGSFAITTAGWVCFSYSPTTSTTIT